MKWNYPLKTVRITQRFGENSQVYKRFGLAGHNGVDFGCATGTALYAPCSMTIKVIGDQGNEGYGRYVRTWTTDGYELTFGHLLSVNPEVKVGTVLAQKTIFAYTDNTGFSTGPHLHFGVRKLTSTHEIDNYNNGYKGAINPLPFFMDDNEAVETLDPEHVAAIKWVSENHIMNIVDANTLGEPMSRKDLALVVHRLYKLIKNV